MNPALLAQTVAVDSAALGAAASIAEEALACHREALLLLAEGWQSETGSAIADFMDLQCSHATDVVDALRSASGQMPDAPESWTYPANDRVGDRTVAPADALPLPIDTAGLPTDPGVAPTSPPAVPAPTAPSMGQTAASPWATPTTAGSPWSGALPPGGMPTPPALPDFGSALVGLVAEIAQALGSYADMAPSADMVPPPDVSAATAHPGTDGPWKPDASLARDTPQNTMLSDNAAPESVPAAPGSAPATTPTVEPLAPLPGSEPQTAPPELLAAERPPAPGAAAAAPVADVPLAAGAPDAPVPDPQPSVAPPSAAAERTPCEIAADELANVGE